MGTNKYKHQSHMESVLNAGEFWFNFSSLFFLKNHLLMLT